MFPILKDSLVANFVRSISEKYVPIYNCLDLDKFGSSSC